MSDQEMRPRIKEMLDSFVDNQTMELGGIRLFTNHNYSSSKITWGNKFIRLNVKEAEYAKSFEKEHDIDMIYKHFIKGDNHEVTG